jgi:hypothetical protein
MAQDQEKCRKEPALHLRAIAAGAEVSDQSHMTRAIKSADGHIARAMAKSVFIQGRSSMLNYSSINDLRAISARTRGSLAMPLSLGRTVVSVGWR